MMIRTMLVALTILTLVAFLLSFFKPKDCKPVSHRTVWSQTLPMADGPDRVRWVTQREIEGK